MGENELPLLEEQRDAALWLTLNRRHKLNAIDSEMLNRLMNALDRAENDQSVRCVVISGSRRAFSSGQDLDEIEAIEAERGPASVGQELRDRYAPLVLKLRELPKPVVAAINGITTGAGLALALGCDLRVASEAATFIAAPYRIGLMPAVGLSILLPALLGLSRAFDVCTLQERIDAQTALDVGLVNRVAPVESFEQTLNDVVHKLTSLPGRAFAMTKAAFNAAALPNLREHLEKEIEWQVEAAISPDHQEGLASLRERRLPRFNLGR
ncbi:enoyl-CoA hydratase-related protein [soil metagenome]